MPQVDVKLRHHHSECPEGLARFIRAVISLWGWLGKGGSNEILSASKGIFDWGGMYAGYFEVIFLPEKRDSPKARR